MQVAHVQLSPDRIRAVHQGLCSRLLLPAAAKYGDLSVDDILAMPPEERGQYCPRGQVGDILWVQEEWMCIAPDGGDWQWRIYSNLPPPGNVEAITLTQQGPDNCLYAATFREGSRPGYTIRWAPASSMPRWASRLYLKIMDVQLVQLKDLTPETVAETGISLQDGDANSLEAFTRALREAYGERFSSPDTVFWSIRFARMDHHYVAQALEGYPRGVPASFAAQKHAELIAQALKSMDLTPTTMTLSESFAGMKTTAPANRWEQGPGTSRSGDRRPPNGGGGNRSGYGASSRDYGGYNRIR